MVICIKFYVVKAVLIVSLAGLERNIHVPFTNGGTHVSTNLTAARNYWDSYDGGRGIVALDDAYVAEKGLPTAQRFPWDRTKGLYMLNSAHNMHCLVGLRCLISSA